VGVKRKTLEVRGQVGGRRWVEEGKNFCLIRRRISEFLFS